MGKNLRFLSLAMLLLLIGAEAMAQTRTVTGKVTSPDGPMPGVSVSVTGTSKGASTDADGNYTVELGASENSLTFSFIGLKTVTVEVGNRTTVDVVMEADVTALDEIVVVGYGEQRKADITGSVVQVKGGEISKQASVNPISALQGKVAGVQITNSGAPGASPQVRIRGLGTVGAGTSPLYVVDGVWYSDISFLNPADIENLSVLKDASSQAIYGVRAANGVIVITTKRGGNRPTQITYEGFYGSQVATNLVEMANGQQYATLINELDVAASGNPAAGRYDDPSIYGTTDWYRQILRSASISNHNVGISGGTDRSSFNFSLGYLRQEGTVEGNVFNRYTARLQNDYKAYDFLKIGFSGIASYNNSDDVDGGIFHQIYAAAPLVPVYYEDGTYGDPNDFGVSSSNLFNPQVTLDYFDQQSKNYRVTGNAYAEAKFLKNFTFRTSWSGDFGQNQVQRYTPVYTATLSQRNTISNLFMSRGETRNWMVENTVSYSNTFFEDHNVTVLAGQSAQHYGYYFQEASAQNVPNTSKGDRYFDQGNNYLLNDDGDIRNVASFFARLNYSFKDKYLLTFTYRADGLSEFVGADRWGHFPAVGLGWVLSEENFMKNQTIFSNLKLRASWGKNGNSNVPTQPAVLVTSIYPLAVFGGDVTGISQTIARQVPPSVAWESTTGTDIGAEFGFFNNKITVELDWYKRLTEKAIFDIPILKTIGTESGTIVGNQASIENTGFEFAANWNDKIGENISFTVGGNFGINKNKVTDVATGENPIYAGAGVTGGATNTRTVIGQPIGQFFGYKVLGIFQSDEDVTDYVSSDGDVIQPSANPGDFKYKDVNDDGVIDGKDRVVLGNPNPKFIFGINTTWNYKQFDFTLDMQGVMGIDVYNAELGFRFGSENFTKDFYENRWHGEGTSNSYPSANIGGGQNYMPNSFYVESGAYFRFRNIQLGYTLPSSVAQRIKMTSVRVFANAQNALTFFKYRGFNPEVGGSSPIVQGIDVNTYPLFATYNVGLNVKF